MEVCLINNWYWLALGITAASVWIVGIILASQLEKVWRKLNEKE